MKKNLLFLFICIILSVSVSSQIITTIAGNGIVSFSGDGGVATNASFNNPASVALDAAGNIYVSDKINQRIRKIAISTGIITTIAGTGTAGFSGDGGQAIIAEMNSPGDICVDALNNIYFVDAQNFRVRKIDPATGIISTVAGNGTASYAGETILAINAGLHYPNGLAVDAANLYISLFSKQRICKVNLATGILSTIGGTGINGYSGDGGPAINASFGYPGGLSISASGEVYVADYNNNRIRKIDGAGIVTTVAGNGTAAFSGDGGLGTNASINLPFGVFVDASDNIFIADNSNYVIRKVTTATGIISTVAGSGSFGFAGDGGSAISQCTKLSDPSVVRVDAAGNIFIADHSNSRIRKVDTSPINTGVPTITILASATTVCSGSSVTFNSVITNGGINPVYQWKRNGLATGISSPSQSFSIINSGDVITCELISSTVCNAVTVTSNLIVITALPSFTPSITIGPDPATVCQGNTITFTAQTSNGGTAPLYQWLLNGNNTGTNSPFYTNIAVSNGDVVRCIFNSSNSCVTPASVTSKDIVVTVNPKATPAVNITSSATNVCSGSIVTFTAVATNSGNNVSYQWKINNINAGNNNPVFTTASIQNNDIVSFSIITDPALTCINANAVNSNQIIMAVSATPAPSISITASDNFICPKTPVTFTAIPLNAGNSPSYTWKLNGITAGVNNAVYTNNNFSNGDQITCMLSANNVTCPASSVSSNIITMAVKSLPVISVSPVNATVLPGTQVQLITTINGSVNFYQWSPPGLLVNPFTLNPFTKPLDSNTTFSLDVTNTEGCSNNKLVEIKVYGVLKMPSAFTPNNDNVNDVFRIPPNVLLTLSDFSIYDRWGNCIFKTNDITKGWDGKYSGMPFNTGVFVYIISGVSQGKKIFLNGSFTLIR
jgi:gliding motility-associated-like protein